jgi:hypothetical protein
MFIYIYTVYDHHTSITRKKEAISHFSVIKRGHTGQKNKVKEEGI